VKDLTDTLCPFSDSMAIMAAFAREQFMSQHGLVPLGSSTTSKAITTHIVDTAVVNDERISIVLIHQEDGPGRRVYLLVSPLEEIPSIDKHTLLAYDPARKPAN